MSVTPRFKHIAGSVYAMPGYEEIDEPDAKALLDVFGDEISSALRIGKVARDAHAAANDLLRARVQANQWNRQFEAFLAEKRRAVS